jgi:hypothetical protein
VLLDSAGRLLLRPRPEPEQERLAGGRSGDKPAVSPATRRRLVAFQLGSDVVGVVDACSRARATVRVLAGGPRHGALSKRIGRAERVARLRNLSADVLIATVAAPVREQPRPDGGRDAAKSRMEQSVDIRTLDGSRSGRFPQLKAPSRWCRSACASGSRSGFRTGIDRMLIPGSIERRYPPGFALTPRGSGSSSRSRRPAPSSPVATDSARLAVDSVSHRTRRLR